MSSRKEEKERLRAEREAAEAKAKADAARKQRFVMVGAGLVAIVIVAGIIFAVTSGGGSSDGPTSASASDVKLPARKITDLNAAAKAAGCVVKTYPSEGREHTTAKVVYKTNPPTSGNHNPEPAQDGVYATGNEPTIGHTVHSLEHGRIEIQYKPGTPPAVVSQLEAVLNENLGQFPAGYHMLLFENQTGMPSEVAATAWTQSLTCATYSPKVIDALRAFRERYTDKGPEFIP